MTREFSREEYTVRITWLIWGRAVLTTFIAVTLFFFQQRYRIYSFHTSVLLYVLASVYALTAFYRYLLKKVDNYFFLAYLQVSVDIFLVTFLVYLTGGIDSGLSILYHLAIISASIILYRRGGYLAASLSSILYGAMLDMQYYDVPGFQRSQNFTAGQFFYQVFINILSFYLVALLSGYLAERLRSTRQALQKKSSDFEDLRVLQEHILKSVGSGILTVNLKGEITSWNPAAEQITGYAPDEIKMEWQQIFGKSIKELFGHTDSLKERPHRFTSQITKKDGSAAMLGMIASLLKDDTNTVRGIILTFQDITKIVEMEEQIRRQERLATVGSLAAGIAHEIRNPLASLSGSIQLLQRDLKLEADDRHLMDIVVREADRLNTIITEFLEYARPRSVHIEHVNLQSLLDETVMLLKNSRDFSEKIVVVRNVERDIHLQGDIQRLKQVFWNLLLNACQAMPSGGTIELFARSDRQKTDEAARCEIIISDTGTGIEREHIGKLFDPFFTTKAEGTGLGLSIAYRIIEDHDGTIEAESETGKGAKFIISLPMAENSATLANQSNG